MNSILGSQSASPHGPIYPLAGLDGRRPERPHWFEQALADTPRRRSIPVDGASIELLSWGRTGAPGLVLVHGSRAHADWWSFIAPFFARDYHVVALSFSGMGGSSARPGYSLAGFADEIVAAAQAEALFDGPQPPLLVGHSFGGIVAAELAKRDAPRWDGLVLMDAFFPRRADMESLARNQDLTLSGNRRSYVDEAAGLARFRLMPPHHGNDTLFVIDHVARGSLRRTEGDETPGWTWRFDPLLLKRMSGPYSQASFLLQRRCPIALIWGEHSPLFPDDYRRDLRRLLGEAVPAIVVPEAGHHVFIDQPLATIAALRGLFASWPAPGGGPGDPEALQMFV